VGTQVYVPDLTAYDVMNMREVEELIEQGRQNRHTFATNMNEHSSRSHSVLMVNIHGRNVLTGQVANGKLNLVDLAGSERISKSEAVGARLKEAQAINKSLSSLGDVIFALTSKSAHVPYRNSKLTYLLQDSLGGDSKTMMFVNCSPALTNVQETTCSLNFAQRVRSVELGQVRIPSVPV
jgi:kinesin family protein C2/C3